MSASPAPPAGGWKFWQVLKLPPRRLVLWHSVAAVPMATVVVLGAYLSYHYHQLSMENRDRVDRAYEVLDVVDGLYISLQNADVAQRDFIVTGDAGHLVAFQSALRMQADDSERLRVLLSESASQEERLAKLDLAVAGKLGELGRTITVRQAEGFDAAREVIRGEKSGAMDDIRQQVTALADAERKLLMRRLALVREHERDTLLAGVFIAALSVTTRILIALGLRWVHARRQVAATDGAASAG